MKTKKSLSTKPLLLKNLIKSGFLISGLLLSSFSSFATTTKTGNLPISSTVSNSCVVKSTDNINLGSYNPSSLVNLNGSGVLSLICTKGAVITASPASGGSSLTGSSGSLSYGLYTDSGMTQAWKATTTLFSNFTGGDTSLNSYSPQNVWFETAFSISGQATIAQIQAANPSFNPNLFYYYRYYNNVTSVYYNYVGQSSANIGVYVFANNAYATSPSPSPDTLLAYNYGVGTSYPGAFYYILPPGTTTGTTGSLGTSYQVPTSSSSNPLTGTATTVTQPVNLTYYAKIPYGQDVAPGVYTDTVVIQVTF